MSQRVGFNLSYRIDNRWEVATGLNSIRQSIAYENQQVLAQSGGLNSFSIPLTVNYYIPLSKVISFYAGLGFYYEFGEFRYHDLMGNGLNEQLSQLGALGSFGIAFTQLNKKGVFFIQGSPRIDLVSDDFKRNEFYLSLGYGFYLF